MDNFNLFSGKVGEIWKEKLWLKFSFQERQGLDENSRKAYLCCGMGLGTEKFAVLRVRNVNVRDNVVLSGNFSRALSAE